MADLRKIIADNISTLRTESGMTQAEFAELFNYSDKAVSKWERGEALPDITVLKQIADHFSVSVDYLLEAEHTSRVNQTDSTTRLASRNKLLITLISSVGVWVLATLIFVVLTLSGVTAPPPWLYFIYAIPVSAIVVLVLNSVWGIRRLNFLIVSVLVWSILLTIHLSVLVLLGHNMWMLYIIGIPAQVLLLFIPGITVIKSGKEKK